MIAIIVNGSAMWSGPIPLALEHAGFETRPAETTDQAGFDVRNHGCEGCVVVVESSALGRRAGTATWTSFLAAHSSVPAVVIVWGEADTLARGACDAPHRLLLENPFDAAAVVAATRRAASRVVRSVAPVRGDVPDVETAG